MRRQLWVEDAGPPQEMLAVLEGLVEGSEGWDASVAAPDVMAELRRLGVVNELTCVHGTIAGKDEERVHASWLEWREWSIIATGQWVFVYPTRGWYHAARAAALATFSHESPAASPTSKGSKGITKEGPSWCEGG